MTALTQKVLAPPLGFVRIAFTPGASGPTTGATAEWRPTAGGDPLPIIWTRYIVAETLKYVIVGELDPDGDSQHAVNVWVT